MTSTAVTSTAVLASVQERRAELEAVIERGLETFVEVGQALQEIRDNKLYAPEYDTFKAYVEDRWQFSDSRARQIIGASKVAIESVTTGNAPPN